MIGADQLEWLERITLAASNFFNFGLDPVIVFHSNGDMAFVILDGCYLCQWTYWLA